LIHVVRDLIVDNLSP